MGVIEASDRAWKGIQMTNERHGTAEWLRGRSQRLRSLGEFSCKDFMAYEFGISSPCKHPRSCLDCYADMFERIADRIDAERALPEGMEWPRFDDGELVKAGDEVEFKGETMRVYLATLDADGWALWCSREGIDGRLSGSYGERVKRPAPKVLGADGAPIEVGDVVYYDGEPHPLTVVGITRDGKDALVDANGEESCVEGGRPQDFSHDAPKPVLDADGVPIEVGDTVYGDDDPEQLIVDSFDGPGCVCLTLAKSPSGMLYTIEPSRLSHERPDSWERIEEDAKLAPRDYLEKRGMNPEKTKLVASMMADLVRRAKALAKAGEQG